MRRSRAALKTMMLTLAVMAACTAGDSAFPNGGGEPAADGGVVAEDGAPTTTDVSNERDTVDAVSPWHPVPPFAVTVATYPKVDGATATLPLDMIIACELLAIPWRWSTGEGEGGIENFVEPLGPLAEAVRAKIVHNKTDVAYRNLIDGSADLVFQASLPSADELAYASQKNVTLESKPVALDALVFLLNASNPVVALSIDQMRDVYMARITRWDEIAGGLPRLIHPYTRPPNSGSFELFQSLVLRGETMPQWPPDLTAVFMGALVNRVAMDTDALGYSVYYYVRYIVPSAATNTKFARVNGVDATTTTIATRTYPLTTETYVVMRKGQDPNSLAFLLREWLLEKDGQRTVKLTGYVPVQP